MSKNYYDILGVSKTANQDEIKKAFRKLAHEHHPDKKGGNEAKFKEIDEAYQVLGNEQKRQQYDQFGSTFNGANFGGGQGFGGQGFNWQDFARTAGGQGGFRSNINFEDIDLGDIFGDFFGGSSQSQRPRRNRGADLEYRMDISLKESAFGAEKVIRVEKLEVCDNCSGKGYDNNTKVITCPQCKGTGKITEQQRTIFGVFQSERVCPTCGGEGKKPENFCHKCHGQGRVKKDKELKIKIPAGINEGESIKLTGEGEAGEKGAAAGDMYITFHVLGERNLRREGYDILVQKEITFSEAALGGKVEVETLDGSIEMKIPAGTQTGKVFKLSGKGAEKLHGRGRGDQLVEIVVKTPTSLSRRAKQLLEELEKEVR